eukprot:CAMPEP_0175155040 /NCGR_PEP_ID=MMETSP0087-20121206/20727_1 /TAXON_ID=136419 /ORGANISM="Unknown Unknown, Strain D1" /LENGTH=278 /DNA_ID=CAMNT_0016442097 /DNA_START=34 /DNA_END=870 /DNA_ORIENTATION=-
MKSLSLARCFFRKPVSVSRLAPAHLSLNRAWGVPPPAAFHRRFATEVQSDDLLEETVSNLLYNVPKRDGKVTRRIVTALVSNEPGVLSRMSGMFASRNFNIESLVVSATNHKEVSRCTIVLYGDDEVVRAIQQIEDMVQVWAVVEYQQGDPVVERELVMIKLACESSSAFPLKPGLDSFDPHVAHAHRMAVLDITKLFNGRIVDMASTTICVEVSAKQARVDAFIKLLKPYGIIEISRSGVLAMVRGSSSTLNGLDAESPEVEPEDLFEVDESMLPPG